jgi:hypothetical protein
LVEVELGMSSCFDSLIGQRIKQKLIDHAYSKEYKGSHDNLLDSIDAMETVINITKQSIIDVIQGEIETFSFRNMEEPSVMMNIFLGGLIHAVEVIENDASTIGQFPVE